MYNNTRISDKNETFIIIGNLYVNHHLHVLVTRAYMTALSMKMSQTINATQYVNG